MSLVYGLKLISDLTFIYAAMGLVGLLYFTTSLLVALPLVLGLGAGLGFHFRESGRGGFWWYAPLGLALCLMPLPHADADWFFALPALVYAVLYIKNNRRATDYYYAFQRFRFSAMLLPITALVASANGSWAWTDAIPYLLMYLTLSVVMFRMLRHEDHTIRERRFQLVNLSGIVAVGGAAVLLATPLALNAMKAAAMFLLRYALMPVLNAIAWVINLILKAVSWLVNLIPWPVADTAMPEAEATPMEGAEMLPPVTAEEIAANPVLRTVLIVVGALALAAVVFFVLRALSKQMSRASGQQRREVRESLDGPGGKGTLPRRVFPRRGDPAMGIRAVYRHFLALSKARGAELRQNANSLQIRDAALAAGMAEAPLDALREAYIHARYRPEGPDADDLKRAKDAYEALRKGDDSSPGAA